MVKVCHVTSVHQAADDRIYYKECRSLVSAGYEVHIVSFGENELSEVICDNCKCIQGGRGKRFAFGRRQIIKKALAVNADIYHFHDPELLPYAKKLKRCGKIVIFDSHEDVPVQILSKTWIPLLLRKPISLCYEKYQKRCIKYVDAVIAATELIQKKFAKYHLETIAIHNYPCINEIFGGEKDFETRKLIVCYAGGISYNRGEQTMISAIKETKGTLYIAGEHEKEQIEGGKVQYCGFLNREEVNELYANSRCGLVVLRPTKAYVESLPVKMFEYMSAGLPVVASDFPYWKSIIDKEKCGICVDPLNVQAVSRAINLFFDNPQLAEEYGQRGKKAVLEKYNWEQEAKKLLKLYLKLVEKNKILVENMVSNATEVKRKDLSREQNFSKKYGYCGWK